MQDDLISVKMERNYHHGDLRQALVDSALTVLAEKGVDGFSLRETARRAGVSPAAYKHHFADTRALMTALATIAFARLADALEQADAAGGQSRRCRLGAQGSAYVRFALAERALFDLMWRTTLLDLSDQALSSQKARAFDCLDRLVRGMAAGTAPGSEEIGLDPKNPYDAVLFNLIEQPEFVIPLLINDPLQVAGAVKIPVLILQGEKDVEASVKDAQYLDEALNRAQHPDHTLRLLPDVDHLLKANKGVARTAIYAETRPVDANVLTLLTEWLQKRLK